MMHCGNLITYSTVHMQYIKNIAAKYFNLQPGYLKMQAGCEIKNMLSEPRNIALLCKRSHACAKDHQNVLMLSNFLQ